MVKGARLPPMWPGFDFWTRRHMWVEFVAGSRPCSEGFSQGFPVFLPPQKPTFPNSKIGHFTVVYSMTRPMNASEAAGDLVLI